MFHAKQLYTNSTNVLQTIDNQRREKQPMLNNYTIVAMAILNDIMARFAESDKRLYLLSRPNGGSFDDWLDEACHLAELAELANLYTIAIAREIDDVYRN